MPHLCTLIILQNNSYPKKIKSFVKAFKSIVYFCSENLLAWFFYEMFAYFRYNIIIRYITTTPEINSCFQSWFCCCGPNWLGWPPLKKMKTLKFISRDLLYFKRYFMRLSYLTWICTVFDNLLRLLAVVPK